MTTEADLQAAAADAQRRAGSEQLVWAVLLDGRIALHGGSTSAVFRIASMTKCFTAATVLARRDRGELRLDDELVGLAGHRATADAAPITIRDVLSMSAGLATDDYWADRHLDMPAAELARLVAGGLAFAHPTGVAYEYSNLGYALLGDQSALTTALLLEPLGLEHTTWVHPAHDWVGPPAPLTALGHGAFAGMGGLWSNLADLATWVAFLDDAFPARDDPDDGPLRRSSRRELQQVHRLKADGSGYGFGVDVERHDRLGTIVGHSGGLPGYGSNMRWLPGRGVGAIALANSTYAPMAALTRQLLVLLDDHGLVPPAAVPVAAPLERAAEDLVALLQRWDDAAADRLFADNVALDEPYAARAAAGAALVATHGALRVETVVAASATDATATVVGARGSFRIEYLMSPLEGGGIQYYEVVH